MLGCVSDGGAKASPGVENAVAPVRTQPQVNCVGVS